MQRQMRKVPFITFFVMTAGLISGEVLTYTDEDEYLSALAGFGYQAVYESFEDDAAWGGVRTSIVEGQKTAPSVTSQGMTWTANNDIAKVTTGGGPALTGDWGFFTLPHGSFEWGNQDCTLPGMCGDGFGATCERTMFGVGGWLDTNTPGATIELRLDGVRVDFGEICDPQGENCEDVSRKLYLAPKFFGAIDADGFSHFVFNELEGTNEDQKLLFCDDFTIAVEPGELQLQFTRGNCNGDSVTDLSDAIAILLYLFDGYEPSCMDGCDLNADTAVGLDDAIVLLQYLFGPDGFSVPSPAPGECLPAREGFCAVSNCVGGP